MGRTRALLKTLTYFIRPLPVSHPVCDVDAGKHARCFSHRAPYLPHAVVLHGDFPKEEVDEVAVIDRLDKIRLWNQQNFKLLKRNSWMNELISDVCVCVSVRVKALIRHSWVASRLLTLSDGLISLADVTHEVTAGHGSVNSVCYEAEDAASPFSHLESCLTVLRVGLSPRLR